ncbi:MAG: DUF2249 domain-containing protein [Gammaproteobacteria bacterium]
MEHRLDTSDLPPPEPMERVLDALDGLGTGGWLRMVHRQQPFPLYRMLQDMGYRHRVRVAMPPGFEIAIWHEDDAQAEAEVNLIFGSDDGTESP